MTARASWDALWPAPAKLNLFLHIIGRRDDGFHILQTVFQLLDTGDELRFTPNNVGDVRVFGSSCADPDRDLVARAAHALRSATGIDEGVDIHLNKRLPVGGGLGGGSSDAATALVALNALWGLRLALDQLARIGLSLGADVPVFVHGASAWAEGIGERLYPVVLEERWFAVITPDCEVSTNEVFASPTLTRNTRALKITDFFRDGRLASVHPLAIQAKTRNDCEAVVGARYPRVQAALDWLSGFATPRMTGTGASIFACFDDQAAARDVVDQLSAGCRGFVARGVNESPLLSMVRDR